MKKMYRLFGLLILVLLLAACGSDSDDADQSDKDADKGSDTGVVEIFSWWTGAGEEDGLLALIDLFEETHDDIEIENAAVAGGAGTNAKAVLATRMQRSEERRVGRECRYGEWTDEENERMENDE